LYSVINFGNVEFGPCSGCHLFALRGGFLQSTQPYTINGSATQAHVYAINSGTNVVLAFAVTLTGTPSFGVAYAWSDRGLAMIDFTGSTFTGSATGKRYDMQNNSICFVAGGGATFLPGSSAGTTSTGAQYN
jgi:hypothetical protein